MDFGQKGLVRDMADYRWTWVADPLTFTSSISPYTTGIDGTAIYSYANVDYSTVDPIFLMYNPTNALEIRPATIYESFLNTKSYVDFAIAERTAAMLNIAASLNIELTGATDGSVIMSVNEVATASPWRIISEYGDNNDYGLVAPGNCKVIANAGFIGFEGNQIRFDTNCIALASAEAVPTGSISGYGRIYYSEGDSSLHLVDHDGNDTALGAGGGGGGGITSISVTSPLATTGGATPDISLGVVGVANGGTGRNTLVMNNVILGNSTGAVQQVAPSTSKNILMSDGTTWNSTALHYESTITTTPTSITMSGYTGYTSTHAVATASIAITINLPALSSTVNGYEIVIFDKDGNASANNITIDPSAGTGFIGMPLNENLVIDTNYGTVGLRKTSLGWLILYTR
jgi:hypothetical protein